MEQITLLKEQVRRKYALETALLRLDRQENAAEEALGKARDQLYAAKTTLEEYEIRFLPRLLDKARGRYPDKIDAMNRDIQKAKAEVGNLKNRIPALRQEREALEKELAELTGCEDALAASGAAPADCRRWRAAFLCETTLTALEESSEALLEYRKLIQGNTLQPVSRSERAAIQGRADDWGEKCRELLTPLAGLLAELEIPFELTGYYANPRAYIVSAAADHNRRDRLNRAIDQNLRYRKQLKGILSELED